MRTALPPLVLPTRSGRYSAQCRHHGCEQYIGGSFPTAALAGDAAARHMLNAHGVMPVVNR